MIAQTSKRPSRKAQDENVDILSSGGGSRGRKTPDHHNSMSSGKKRLLTSSAASTDYKERLSTQSFFYLEPPCDMLSLDEFETFAVDRLVVLRLLESLRSRNVAKPRDLEKHLGPTLSTHLPRTDARKDAVSHFILRLAYSRTEELRRWFLTQECALFKYRLEQLKPRELTAALKKNDLTNFTEVDDASKREKGAQLKAIMQTTKAGADALAAAGGNLDRVVVYRIPFFEATDAVGRRAVLVDEGFAWVPEHRLHAIVSAKFRTHLSKSMTLAARSFAKAAADPRLGPLLKHVDEVDVLGDRAGVGQDGADSNDLAPPTPQTLDDLAQKAMPLCMKQCHQGLRKDHKLKHWGRLQYGLFLKAGGLSMDHALAFFEQEFTKVMTHDQFNKEYAYDIRHRYGQEGKRADYSAYGCFKLIMDFNPGPGEAHGCPFKYLAPSALASVLGKAGIDSAGQLAIAQQVKSNNFQVACQLHFDLAHPNYADLQVDVNGVGNHPNAWFRSSRRYAYAKAGGNKLEDNKLETTTQLQPSSSQSQSSSNNNTSQQQPPPAAAAETAPSAAMSFQVGTVLSEAT